MPKNKKLITRPSFRAVIRNTGFVNLWINQILVQLAYNSLNFALILWVFRMTNSNIAVAGLLVCVYLPSVLLGLFAGIYVDVTDRKKVIRNVNLLLSIAFLSLIFFKGQYVAVLIITFIINALSQIYISAEASAIPLIVKKSEQLLAANSLFSITLFSSFLVGFGLAGPLILFLHINTLFFLEGTLLFIAFLLTFKFPPIVNTWHEQGKKLVRAINNYDFQMVLEIGQKEIRDTFNLIGGKTAVTASLFILASLQVVIGILGVLIPSFFEHVIQVNAPDASFVLILPLGIGMIIGGFFIGRYGYRFPKRKIVTIGIIGGGLIFLILGLAPLVLPVIEYFPRPRPLPFFYQIPLSSILAIGSFLLGLTMVSVAVPTQTVIQENTPEYARGKVFSVLGVLMAGFTLLPVILAGIIADIFGPMPLFIAMGGVIALVGLLALKPDFYFAETHLPYRFREFLGLGHWKRN